MTTPTGTITMADVNDELGYASTANISLNQADVRELAGKPTGIITLDDLRGKSLPLEFKSSGWADGTGAGTTVNFTAAKNDLVVVFVSAAASANGVYTAPAGWGKLYDTFSVGLYDTNGAVFYKRMTTAETSMTFTYDTGVIPQQATYYVIRGSHPTDPIGASSVKTALGNTFSNSNMLVLESTNSFILQTWAGAFLGNSLDTTPTTMTGYSNTINNLGTGQGTSTTSKLYTGGGTLASGRHNVISVYDGDATQIMWTIEVKGQ